MKRIWPFCPRPFLAIGRIPSHKVAQQLPTVAAQERSPDPSSGLEEMKRAGSDGRDIERERRRSKIDVKRRKKELLKVRHTSLKGSPKRGTNISEKETIRWRLCIDRL